MNEKTGISKNQILSELSRSPHGKLEEYLPLGKKAAMQEPEFMAHLIAWNQIKGQVRDSQVALPIIALTAPALDPEFVDNAMAHAATLGPREFERAMRFALAVRLPGKMRALRRLIAAYLRKREGEGFDRVGVQHRHTLAALYALGHVKRGPVADVLFKSNERKPGSMFDVVANLKTMSPVEAAGAILENRIPFLIAFNALREKAKEPDIVLALINRMSATELVTNTKMLERFGMKANPALRGAYDEALQKAEKDKKNVLKTARAAESIGDKDLSEKLHGLAEKRLAKMGVEGDWLVLCDKSPSMVDAIETGRHVAALLGKMAKGKVTLIFFDGVPARVFDVTGQTLDQIKLDTKHLRADGSGTSIGCGIRYAIDRKVEADGIVIVSDAQENTAPIFADEYRRYCKMLDKQLPVYLYRLATTMMGLRDRDLAESMKRADLDLQEFDLRGGVDYYSLPNIVQTMRTNRYSLIEEVMSCKLLKLSDVFPNLRKEEMIHA